MTELIRPKTVDQDCYLWVRPWMNNSGIRHLGDRLGAVKHSSNS